MLSAGATIVQALEPAPWSALYGMLKDRFGIIWVLDVVARYESHR
jgi:PhnB protein